jgi:integrase
MASITKRPNGRWRARYRDANGQEHARHFDRKVDGQRWLDEVTASVVTGTYVDPKTARTTVREWSETWIAGYSTRRASTVSQARTHLRLINATFGDHALASVRPSEVRSWTGTLRDLGYAVSTVHALHSRLGQLFCDAVHDGLLPRSPVSRRTSPGAGKQRPYVATTAQVWALHDALPDPLRPMVLLGAFAGLRRGEIIALRVHDVDFMGGIISPEIQYPSEPLKTEISRMPIPIPHELALELNRVPTEWGSEVLVVGATGQPITPSTANKAFGAAKRAVEGLPAEFRLHDLRHYYASMLIAAGLDVKVVQARLRHASAKTTLDTYGHLWPDSDESARAAVARVFSERPADRARTVPA